MNRITEIAYTSRILEIFRRQWRERVSTTPTHARRRRLSALSSRLSRPARVVRWQSLRRSAGEASAYCLNSCHVDSFGCVCQHGCSIPRVRRVCEQNLRHDHGSEVGRTSNALRLSAATPKKFSQFNIVPIERRTSSGQIIQRDYRNTR